MSMPDNFVGKAVPIQNQKISKRSGGRKPKILKQWIKECNVGKKNAQDILKNLLILYTADEIDQQLNILRSEVPALAYMFLNNIAGAINKQDTRMTKEILDFAFGGDPQIAVTNNTKFVDLKAIILKQAEESPEERERIIAELERLSGYTEDE